MLRVTLLQEYYEASEKLAYIEVLRDNGNYTGSSSAQSKQAAIKRVCKAAQALRAHDRATKEGGVPA